MNGERLEAWLVMVRKVVRGRLATGDWTGQTPGGPLTV